MTIHILCRPSPRNTWESTRMKARKRSESFSVGAAIGSRKDSRWNFSKMNVCVLWKNIFQTPVEVEMHISKRHKQLLKWRTERSSSWLTCDINAKDYFASLSWFVVFLQKAMNLQISNEALSYSLMMAQSWSKDQLCMQCRSNFHEYKYGMDWHGRSFNFLWHSCVCDHCYSLYHLPYMFF